MSSKSEWATFIGLSDMANTLREYIDKRYAEGKEEGYYDSKNDWKWTDEGLIYAIEDYLHENGSFGSKDIDTLSAYGFIPEDFEEE